MFFAVVYSGFLLLFILFFLLFILDFFVVYSGIIHMKLVLG